MITILSQRKNCVVNYQNMEAIQYVCVKHEDEKINTWEIRALTVTDDAYVLGKYKTEDDCKQVFKWLLEIIILYFSGTHQIPHKYIEMPLHADEIDIKV